uniref:thermospermine synthase n=1 Tax=Zooxanthella nutricula TaxID=1333877 RepID=A0A7S2N2J4_9DINO
MSKWIEEELEEGLRGMYRIKKILASTKSKWQQVDVMDLEPFGRCLMIDGLLQSTEADEFVYHESLVHPAMILHPCPKTVYIGGGGEGATAREVLRHKTVERCVMVDIDDDVVRFCKDHLPENKEAWVDPRLELVIDDAKKILEESQRKFDVIIMDLDDPLEGGPCYQLYTKEFYEMCRTKLQPGGVLVTQASQAGITRHHIVWSAVNSTLRAVFPRVLPYSQAIYSFMDEWGWHLALSDAEATSALSPEEVDKRIKDRIQGELRFLDGESWQGLFALSKKHRQTLREETCVMTKGTHRFMHNTGMAVAEDNAKADSADTKRPRTESGA